MNTDEFFESVRPWSKRKHRLLGKYLKPFSAKVATATQNREIFCVDGFAGAAKYEDGSDGSPLLMARFADECATWKNPVNLKLINVEPDGKHDGIFLTLEQSTVEWTQKGVIQNINKDFRTALPEIINIVGNAPALFFIDPFGPTYLHFADITPLLSRSQQITELIINFDQDGLRRIADAALSENINPKAAQSNSLNITRIIGNDRWKSKLVDPRLPSNEKESILLGEYLANIAEFGFAVVAYPIREALDSKPKYHFVYCTRHSDGLDLMNDFIREEEDLLFGEHVQDKLTLFPSESLAYEEVTKRQTNLRYVMREYVKTQHFVTRKQIIRNIVASHFGFFHGRDYRAIFKELIDNGTLTSSDLATRIDDRTYLVSADISK